MSENLNDVGLPVSGADPRKIAMSDFEVSTREELVEKGAYVPVVVPYYSKYTADGHERPVGDFDNLGKNYVFPLDRNENGGGGGMTPEEVQEIVDAAVAAEESRAVGAEESLSEDIGVEENRATEAENALSDRIDALEGTHPAVLVGWDNEEGYYYDPEFDGDYRIFDVYPLEVFGTDIRIDGSTHRVKCRAGWYHVDATFSLGGGNALPEYMSVWVGAGVNGVFSGYTNYDRGDFKLFHEGDSVLHVSTTVHVTEDDSTLDFATRMLYDGEDEPNVYIYLDQFSVCRVASLLAGGSGPSDDSDVEVFHIDFGAMLEQYTDWSSYRDACRQLWTDMITAAFNDKVVMATMPGTGICTVEMPMNIQGIPQDKRESALEYMQQYPENGIISLFIRFTDMRSSSFYYDSLNIYKFTLDWDGGLQPRYFAYIHGTYGIQLAVSDLHDSVDGLSRIVDAYNVTPYKLEFDNPDFVGGSVVTDYSQMFKACCDLANRGYSSSADISWDSNGSYMFGNCYINAYASDHKVRLNITGLYTDGNDASLLGNYTGISYYYEGAEGSYWLIEQDDLLLAARGGNVREISGTDFTEDTDNALYYVNVYNGDSVYVESLPDTNAIQFRVCESPSYPWSTYNENVSIVLPVDIQGSSLNMDVADSDGYSLFRQAGALTTLYNDKVYAIEIQHGYFNCVELDDPSA